MKYIQLTQGYSTMVDDEDFDELSKYKWYRTSKGYANRAGKNKQLISMHRVIMNTPDGLFTDHINRNPLDNRKSNLRIVTTLQNNLNRGLQRNNTSGFRGVFWDTRSQKWAAKIKVKGKQVHLGFFDSKEKAAIVYKQAYSKYYEEV